MTIEVIVVDESYNSIIHSSVNIIREIHDSRRSKRTKTYRLSRLKKRDKYFSGLQIKQEQTAPLPNKMRHFSSTKLNWHGFVELQSNQVPNRQCVTDEAVNQVTDLYNE